MQVGRAADTEMAIIAGREIDMAFAQRHVRLGKLDARGQFWSSVRARPGQSVR
jgi:hypothetical protein